MEPVTVLGVTADPAELLRLAGLAEELTAELAALDPGILTPQTLGGSPAEIAARLRSVVAWLEKRQRGETPVSALMEHLPPSARRRALRAFATRERR